MGSQMGYHPITLGPNCVTTHSSRLGLSQLPNERAETLPVPASLHL